jgi:FkbM family methyltransferase
MEFSKIPQTGFFAKFFRKLLLLIPSMTHMRIIRGSLKGKKWLKGSGVNSHWLGIYEIEKQKYLEKCVLPGKVFYDVGAHAGYYSLLASTLVEVQGKVISIEPNPRNLYFLRKNLEANLCLNVEIISCALSSHTGIAQFDDSHDSYQGNISNNGKIWVCTVTLDNLVYDYKLPLPDYIKLDIEGAEYEALIGGIKVLSERQPILVLATHNPGIAIQCHQLLRSLGYYLFPLNPKEDISKSSEIIAKKVGF